MSVVKASDVDELTTVVAVRARLDEFRDLRDRADALHKAAIATLAKAQLTCEQAGHRHAAAEALLKQANRRLETTLAIAWCCLLLVIAAMCVR